MRTIEYTSQFKRDYKREIKGKHKAILSSLFVDIIETLARDEPLAAKHRDHALIKQTYPQPGELHLII